MGTEGDDGQDPAGQDPPGAGDGDGGGAGAPADDHIRSVVREVLAELGVGAGGGGDGGGGAGEGAPAPGGSRASEEAWYADLVRRELERVKSADDVASLKETVKQIVERPPKKYKRRTAIMWGNDE